MFRPVLWLLAAGALLSRAQSPTVRIDVDYVEVNAVVTDATGVPVTGLSAADFTILADGVQQQIAQCKWTPAPALSSRPPFATSEIAVAPGIEVPGPVRPSVTDRNAITQSTAILVDDLGLSAASRPFVRDALRKLALRQSESASLTAILRTSSRGAVPIFTADRRLIEDVAAKLTFRTTGRSGLSNLASLKGTMGVFTEFEPRGREAISALYTLEVLAKVSAAMAGMPGRRSILMFSENLPGPEVNDGAPGRLRDAYDRVRQEAARASVVINVIDPSGAVSTAPDATDEFVHMPVSAMRNWEGRRVGEIETSENGLAILSRDTGGVFIRSVNDASAAVERLANGNAGYYALGFHFDPPQHWSAFHELKVHTTRAGLSVRARTGFFDPAATPRQAQPGNPIERAIESPYAATEVKVRVTPLFSSSGPGKYFVNTLIHVAAGDLAFQTAGDGAATGSVSVYERISDAAGAPVATARSEIPLRFSRAEFARVRDQGLAYVVHDQIPGPGAYFVHAIVGDRQSGRLGSATQVIDVPEIDSSSLALSSILIEKQMSRAPEGAGFHDRISEVEDSDALRDSAVRIFPRGARLSYGCIIFDGEKHRGPERLEFETILFAGSTPVYSSPLEPLRGDREANSARRNGQWALTLGSRLMPGDYTLELIVVDRSRQKTPRAAAQTVNFVIR